MPNVIRGPLAVLVLLDTSPASFIKLRTVKKLKGKESRQIRCLDLLHFFLMHGRKVRQAKARARQAIAAVACAFPHPWPSGGSIGGVTFALQGSRAVRSQSPEGALRGAPCASLPEISDVPEVPVG